MKEEIEKLAFTLTYNQILGIENPNLRDILIKMYEAEASKILASYPGLEDYFDYSKSIEYNYENLEMLYNESISEYLFPKDKVLYYPIVEEFKAKVEHTCAVSGAIITPGSYYEQFKAFLYNTTKNESYVSKKIRYEWGSDFKVPTTLHEFENFYWSLEHAYELNLDESYNIQANIRGMSLQRLKRRIIPKQKK